MVDILISFRPSDSIDGFAQQIEGVVRVLGDGHSQDGHGNRVNGNDAPAVSPSAPSEQYDFSGWLQLLSHLERLMAMGSDHPGQVVAPPHM